MDSRGTEIMHSTTSSTEPTPPPYTIVHPSTSNLDDPATASIAASSVYNYVLEVDSTSTPYDNSDADSAISDVRGLSFTQSASSSIYNFVEEHGRTYHNTKRENILSRTTEKNKTDWICNIIYL